MYELNNLNLPLGKKIGVGSERSCYINAADPRKCFKISKKANCDQTLREIEYFRFLKCRGVDAYFIPKIYKIFESENFVGYEQECFLEKEKGGIYDEVYSLDRYILKRDSDLMLVKYDLENLKNVMIEKNIICSDLSASNILKVKTGGASKLVVIDGYGASEFFPLCKYLRFLGKKKIERQWKKLERRINKCFALRSRVSELHNSEMIK